MRAQSRLIRFTAVSAAILSLAFAAPAAFGESHVPVRYPTAVRWVGGHPVNAAGFVLDGSPQLDDDHCVGTGPEIGMCMVARRYWYWPPFYDCLTVVVDHEDPAWNPTEWNGSGSGAYGIPQALPGAKMVTAGLDWATNPRTQLRWLLDQYAPGRYGGICQAAWHENAYGTY